MSNHTDLLARVVAMEEAAFSGSQGYPYFYQTQEQPPYWVNRLGPAQYSWDSEDIAIVRRDLVMRLVIARLTQGYSGEAETELLDNLDAIIQYFLDRPDLTSSTYPSSPVYLYSEETDLTADSGLLFWQRGENAPVEIGIEFTLSVLYRVDTP